MAIFSSPSRRAAPQAQPHSQPMPPPSPPRSTAPSVSPSSPPPKPLSPSLSPSSPALSAPPSPPLTPTASHHPLPTLVLVPGAWHTSTVYSPLISLLTPLGYPCIALDLPSVGGLVESMHTDTLHIRSTLERLVLEEEKEVVLVMHSYGGLPGSGAVEGLERRRGRKGGVKQFVFLGSFILDKGQAALDLLQGALPPWAEPMGADGKFLKCVCPEELWYHDLPPEEAQYWAGLLKPQCTVTFLTPVSHPGWLHIPSTYLITSLDRAIPSFIQEQMLAAPAVNLLVAKGRVRVERAESGHTVMISQAERVASIVRTAAGEGSC